MVKLLIIADDFTEALDTGAQLTKRGVKARIVANLDYNLTRAEGDALVLDAETRQLSKEESGAAVRRLVDSAKKAGVSPVYMKTHPERDPTVQRGDGEIQFYDTETSLADKLKLKGKAPKRPKLPPSLFLVCGSVDPAIRQQIKEAERCKFKRICLAVRQKLDPDWLASEGCAQAAARWVADATTRRNMILDANDEAAEKATRQFASENGLDDEQVQTRVTSALAGVTKELLDCGLEATLMCVGGDTVKALMAAVGASVLTLICELEEGVTLSSLIYRKKTYYIIEEPDGFDEPDLLCRLADLLGA
ncbi:MAG: hypothetical protein IJU98_07405 [Synergistaceae bacterium]|nr:hypothetical protein [Synergistaceae bacterium]